MKHILTCVSVIVISLLFSYFVLAQSTLPVQANGTTLSEDAPLAETQIWLKEQIRAHAQYKIKVSLRNKPHYFSYRVESIGFEGCTLTYVEVITDSSLKGKLLSTHKSELKVDLAALDYSRVVLNRAGVNVGNYTVDAYTTGNKFIVEHRYEYRSGSVTKRDDRPMGQISFVFTNEDKAKKVVRALSHAIRLCYAQKAE